MPLKPDTKSIYVHTVGGSGFHCWYQHTRQKAIPTNATHRHQYPTSHCRTSCDLHETEMAIERIMCAIPGFRESRWSPRKWIVWGDKKALEIPEGLVDAVYKFSEEDTSTTPPSGESKSEPSKMTLRKKLKAWLIKTLPTRNPETCTKGALLTEARILEPSITQNLFEEIWVGLPEETAGKFRVKGRRFSKPV